jgi:hypothetical protein
VFDGDGDTIAAQICHINAKSAGGPRYDCGQSEKERNDYDNLILLCPEHHKQVDEHPDRFTADDLRGMKAVREQTHGRPETKSDGNIAKRLLQVYVNSVRIDKVDGSLQINSPASVVVKNISRSVVVGPPPGTIGADQRLVRYIKHLIDRYNTLAAGDPKSTRDFRHGVLQTNIRRKFGSAWQDLSVAKAEAVIEHIQGKIDGTTLGKINKGRGNKNYSGIPEFEEKYG